MTDWIAHSVAGEILGLHPSKVAKLVADGKLTPRRQTGRLASLDRAEVVALAETRAVAQRTAEEGRQEREDKRVDIEAARTPPDTEHEWLRIREVAALLGVSDVAVGARIRRGRLPFTEVHGTKWVRRDLLDLVERARVTMRTRQPTVDGSGERRPVS